MGLNYQQMSKDEINKAFPKRGQMNLSEYEAMMRGLGPGDAIAVELGDLSTRQLKRRITSAAKSVLDGHRLRYQDDPSGRRLLVLVRQ